MNTKKYPVAVWTKQPVRKFRMHPVTQAELTELQQAIRGARGGGDVSGATKAGNWVSIPMTNVAYIEVEGLGRDLQDAAEF